jgi:hypothetical protein
MGDDMTELFNPVVPNRQAPTELQYHQALVAGLARVAGHLGRGNLADKSNRTTRALDKLFSGAVSDTSGKGLLDFLRADPTALDEVLALYGFQLAPIGNEPAIDFDIIADTAALAAEHTEAMRDGRRDHNETIRIANKARPVVARYQGIIAEADALRVR